ncbi:MULTISPECIES: 5'-3' exonuclease H3TH domain-containing protein [unclassified Candidatus Cardinium]|uniref:5'-3' exonuclease n=1 Tax=unclassified Candidatus Cardinium TaxID=2641185 RepID=UPI001FB26E38|nr:MULTISPECIES: 5'-3' exonuclease H3TH domain-containing protein [unclassified Candidatus Cardinium]
MVDTLKKLFLLDGMSLIYRAHFALSKVHTTTAEGIETGAILGFVNTLLEVLQKEKPTHIIVAFDSKEKTFRHELFTNYKSHRPAQPEAISIAIPYIQSILDGFGILSVSCKGYEADDLLGTLAHKGAAMGCTTYIMSTDKDLAQMVTDVIYLYKPSSQGQKASIIGKKEILAQWEIARPEQVKDILALEGDPSDFIPGIPSIGKKTARKLIKEFDSLENLLAHSDHLTGRLKTNLIQYAEQGILSKELATIRTDVPITLDLEKCHYQGPSRTKLEPLFTLLEFKQLKQRLFGRSNQPKGQTANLFEPMVEPAAM